MATALKLRADIKKYEAALKSKATPQSLKAKLEKQLEKAKGDLADMRAKKPTEKKGKKGDLPKQFGAYKGSGVDIKKDSERPAKPVGKRKSKSGKTYYEYRLNRIDIKQPPKKYPKLEDGGAIPEGYHQMPDGSIMADSAHMAKGLEIHSIAENMSDTEYDEKYNELNEKQKSKVQSLIRLGDSPKLALATVLDGGFEVDENSDTWKLYSMAHGGELHRMDEVKMAKGGATEHGLKMGDKIWADQFWENTIVVDNPKTGRAVVNLETGDRKEQGKMAKGGYMANGGETKTFNPSEFRNLLDKSIETLYMGLNEVEQAMRYLEVHNMGKKAYSIGEKIGLPSLRVSIENLDQASTNI